MTNYEFIKNMNVEDMAKMNVRAFTYMSGYRIQTDFYTTDQHIFNTREEAEKYELEWLKSNEDRDIFDTMIFKK